MEMGLHLLDVCSLGMERHGLWASDKHGAGAHTCYCIITAQGQASSYKILSTFLRNSVMMGVGISLFSGRWKKDNSASRSVWKHRRLWFHFHSFSACVYLLFSHCSSRLPALAGQNLSPLFPRIWKQIRKKSIIIMATLLRSLIQLSFIQTLWEGWSRGTLTSCRSLPRRLHQGYWNNELEQWNWGELHHQAKHWLTEYKQEACYGQTS